VEALLWQRLSATRRSLPAARHDARAALEAAGITDPTLLSSLGLALSEAVANAILHAYRADAPGEIEITIARDDRRVIVRRMARPQREQSYAGRLGPFA